MRAATNLLAALIRLIPTFVPHTNPSAPHHPSAYRILPFDTDSYRFLPSATHQPLSERQRNGKKADNRRRNDEGILYSNMLNQC
ncbi:MAG: hypothetical protein IJK84_07650 [Bacteroidales bacterium]|nr:hypothetical protein [Bacteroidales bacterium]